MDRKRWSNFGRSQNACAADGEGNRILNVVFQLVMLGFGTVPLCWNEVKKFILKPVHNRDGREYCGDVVEAMLGVTELHVAEALEFRTYLCNLYPISSTDFVLLKDGLARLVAAVRKEQMYLGKSFADIVDAERSRVTVKFDDARVPLRRDGTCIRAFTANPAPGAQEPEHGIGWDDRRHGDQWEKNNVVTEASASAAGGKRVRGWSEGASSWYSPNAVEERREENGRGKTSHEDQRRGHTWQGDQRGDYWSIPEDFPYFQHKNPPQVDHEESTVRFSLKKKLMSDLSWGRECKL
jgi:hypothetical protein